MITWKYLKNQLYKYQHQLKLLSLKKVLKVLPLIHINSSKRTSINSSRFNYKIDLAKNNININDLSVISKMVIPIEDNYIFSIPVIVLTINELNCNIQI